MRPRPSWPHRSPWTSSRWRLRERRARRRRGRAGTPRSSASRACCAPSPTDARDWPGSTGQVNAPAHAGCRPATPRSRGSRPPPPRRRPARPAAQAEFARAGDAGRRAGRRRGRPRRRAPGSLRRPGADATSGSPPCARRSARPTRERSAMTARKEALELGLARKDGAGALLAASGRLSGLLGSVAALITVQPGAQTAVAAALGSAADAVAVDGLGAAVGRDPTAQGRRRRTAPGSSSAVPVRRARPAVVALASGRRALRRRPGLRARRRWCPRCTGCWRRWPSWRGCAQARRVGRTAPRRRRRHA